MPVCRRMPCAGWLCRSEKLDVFSGQHELFDLSITRGVVGSVRARVCLSRMAARIAKQGRRKCRTVGVRVEPRLSRQPVVDGQWRHTSRKLSRGVFRSGLWAFASVGAYLRLVARARNSWRLKLDRQICRSAVSAFLLLGLSSYSIPGLHALGLICNRCRPLPLFSGDAFHHWPRLRRW